MRKLIGVHIWGAGIMALTLLAGCATSSPSMAPNPSAALRGQDADAQQATMSGERDIAKDKEKVKEKDVEKREAGKKHDQQPCPPGQQMSSPSQTSTHGACPPAKMADKAKMHGDKEKDKAKMPGDKEKDKAKMPGDKEKDKAKMPGDKAKAKDK